MQLSHALTLRRISRSLVVILGLTLIQSIVPPIIAPQLVTPNAEAVTATITPTSNAAGTNLTIPAGVSSVTIEAMGGGGGKGGNDGNVGTSGTVAGRVITTIAVSPGDVLGLYGGKLGTAGNDGAQGNGGGAGADDTLPAGPFLINGTYYSIPIFAGGAGGNAGSSGSSGGGGGAGAASIATINNEIVVVAGGAGGGGGAGNGTSVAYNWGGTIINNGSNFSGSNGTGLAAANSCPGATNNNGDGGGGGGGGGGYFAGAGGTAPLRTSECSGTAGSPGGNYVAARGTSTTDDRQAQTNEGYVKYTYNFDAVTACAKSVSTFDIYTIESITTTGQCTWSVPSTVSVLDLFLVGGGGGGGGDGGGGGGGGAALSRTAIAVTANSTLTLKAGYGGVGGAWGNPINTGGATGDSTTVTLATGTTFSALGGSGATTSLGAAGGVGGTAANAGFAGGAGGIAATSTPGNIGGAGKTGISNYYTGSKIEYGGGGGGGTFVNGSATTAATGASGGGAGGYAASSALNIPGANGTNGLGGGGGGGIAINAGTGVRVYGGKGGSGVILIRYATLAADSFPASLASAVAARFNPSDLQVLDSTRKGWIDSSGNMATIANSAITGSPSVTSRGTMDVANSTGSSKTLLVAKGGTGDKVDLITLPTNYTMFHLTRYVTALPTGRIISSTAGNNLSGHHAGTYKCAYHETWLTGSGCSSTGIYRWLLSTDQLRYYRADGADVTLAPNDSTYLTNQALSGGVTGINNFWNSQPSAWEVAELVFFNRRLSHSEIILMENWIARVNGLTIDRPQAYSETDTAGVFNATQFYKGFYKNDFVVNDTFTVETWVKPASSCATGICAIFSSENVLVTKIDSGVFQFALDGTTDRWVWVNTGVKVASNEWHHVAMTKKLIGNQANSIEIYLDGQLAYTHAGNPYTGGATASGTTTDVVRAPSDYYYIGARTDSTRYSGAIDEFKFWSVARTGAEVASDMHSNATSSPNLSLYYDFNSDTLANSQDLQNLAQYGPGRSYMVAVTNMVYEEVKVVSTSGPYTTITFPRTYITQSGGWKVPASFPSATTIVVGGGGGAGKSDSNVSNPGGSGGGGGVTYSPTQTYIPGSTLSVIVGTGGRGATTKADDASTRNGSSSFLGVQGGLTALGGGGGGSSNFPGAGGSTIATGGGGGGNSSAGSCAVQGPSGGTVTSGYNGATGGWGWGGLGGSARGAATTNGCKGIAGSGFVDSIAVAEYGRSGSNDSQATWSTESRYTTANNGWGGSVSYLGSAVASGAGISGSAGVVILRYITASKPSYTAPTNAYLNVGMTETFTVNVAQDSATAMLTRTFKWESSTTGAGGPFTTIKQGTGAANASLSWVPSDTSTSGNQYLYRVVVTDSDTAGLFIRDTSTAVFAVINGTLTMTGLNSIKKQINVARSDTYTVFAGTSTYRYSLSPTIPGITLDSTTAMSPVLKISDTATVGTYLETITVIDSVSARVDIPLTIVISAPPTLIDAGEVVTTGQVLALDAANSASYNKATGAWSDVSGSKKPITVNSSTGAPTYSDDNSGVVKFDRTKYQALYTNGIGRLNNWTIDTWIRIDEEPGSQRCAVTSEYVPSVGFNYFMCIDTARTIFTGFYIPNGWTYMRTTQVVPLDTWVHLVGTWNGSKVKLYINGVLAPGTEIYESAGLVAPGTDSQLTYIAKWWDTGIQSTSAYYAPISVGSVKIYNLALTETQTAQNYNATKDRFAAINQTQLKPAQKYGALNIETFTVTSGGDTKTVTFAVGNRTGIRWDTSTAGIVRLSVQESITPGTYYDTITVTDNFAQSTNLPIKFTISKADTITVTAGVATSQVFNKLTATALPNFAITGLVSSDTGTVLRKYTGVDWTKSCALGGGCEVGDTGPGGGTIFYISPTDINAATGISAGGKYLEVAPINWSGLAGESTTAWSKVATSVAGTLSAIGAGAENTRLINNVLTTNSVAAKVSSDLVLNGKSDWFLPSTLEVKEMYEALYLPNLAGGLSIKNYWSSTQGSSTGQADTYWFGNGGLVSPTDKLGAAITLRPIRAYSPDTITVTTVPTFVDSYTVTVDTVTLTTGSLSNYENVIFQKSGLDITKARQDPLTVSSYVGTFGTAFTATILGGSGPGAFTESITAGSTAAGCAVLNHVITSTTAGNCNLQMKKAYSRNYFTETATATLYLLVWAMNQPSSGVGSGATIALNGQTLIFRDPNAAPIITSLSTYTAQAGVTQIVINGAGFDHLDPGSITVKFWRNRIATGFTVSLDDSQITVTVPAGTTTGRVLVTTPNGSATSTLALTIL